MKKFGLVSLAVSALVGITALSVFGASSVSKLGDLVIVGLGGVTTKSITFDAGHGASNAFIQGPSGGGLKLSANGTALMSVPTATDVLVGRATTDNLTNKTLLIKDGSSFIIENASDITKQVQFSLSSIGSGNTQTITVPNTSGTLEFIDTNQTISGTRHYTADQTITSAGSLTISDTGGTGNVPHNCAAASSGSTNSNDVSIHCPGNKIVTGGGCDAGAGATQIERSTPATQVGSNFVAWHCTWQGGQATANIAYAICCDY